VRYQRLPDLQAIGVELSGAAADFSEVGNATLPASWDTAVTPGSRDLRQLPGAAAIDIGEILSYLNDGFFIVGQPDAGAYELGQSLPHYGPRSHGWIWGDGFESGNAVHWSDP
jgi:hypothetical protein